MLNSLVEVLNVLSLVRSIIFSFLTGTESGRFKGRVNVPSFDTFVATQLKQVMCTSFIIKTCYVTKSRTEKRSRVEDEGFLASSVLNY